ncbi:hypothetical protein FGIG_11410 [Fasciola gigantica]|uniref:Uncharacterized protein n=1 Tax=Fasciola gigantica TaxID=46835 RepID=A0A504YZZ4_FASGI|nr:hypothetical protein FGIG_11410 [Fasciola gigantica]
MKMQLFACAFLLLVGLLSRAESSSSKGIDVASFHGVNFDAHFSADQIKHGVVVESVQQADQIVELSIEKDSKTTKIENTKEVTQSANEDNATNTSSNDTLPDKLIDMVSTSSHFFSYWLQKKCCVNSELKVGPTDLCFYPRCGQFRVIQLHPQ